MKKISNKNVLITGASGFIGSNLIKKLLKKKQYNIFATIHKKNLRIKNKKINYQKVDLKNINHCLKVTKKIDYVFMCAANSSGAKIIQDNPLAHFSPNIIMNTNMLEASHKNNVKKFIFISSSTVYPLTNYPVSEKDAKFIFFEKYYIVGWMKRFSEIMCTIYKDKIKNQMRTLVVRPGNLYGVYDKFNKEESKVIPALIRRIIEKQNPMEVWGDGKDLKDFLYIDDFIEALIKVSFSNKDVDIINIASGRTVTVQSILSKILKIEKFKPKIYFDSSKPTLIPRRSINISKLKRNFRWKQKTSLESGLKKTIQWYKSYYKFKSPEDI